MIVRSYLGFFNHLTEKKLTFTKQDIHKAFKNFKIEVGFIKNNKGNFGNEFPSWRRSFEKKRYNLISGVWRQLRFSPVTSICECFFKIQTKYFWPAPQFKTRLQQKICEIFKSMK